MQHSQLRIWNYHNSYSGGNTICIMDGMLSMPGFNAVNNVVSNGGMTSVAAGWPSGIGVVDHNFVTGSSGMSAAALGAPVKRRDGTLFTLKPTENQQSAGGPIWPSDQVVTDFTLPGGSSGEGKRHRCFAAVRDRWTNLRAASWIRARILLLAQLQTAVGSNGVIILMEAKWLPYRNTGFSSSRRRSNGRLGRLDSRAGLDRAFPCGRSRQ